MTMKVPRQEVERAARIYKSSADAGRALGVAPGSFTRMCRVYGIETPCARGGRLKKDAY
jgi:hypothetical protein